MCDLCCSNPSPAIHDADRLDATALATDALTVLQGIGASGKKATLNQVGSLLVG